MKKITTIIVSILISLSSQAQLTENDAFSSDDLSKEVVYPKVDYPEMVLNKKLTFTNRWDFSLDKISVTDELFYNNNLYGLKLGYYIDEFRSFGGSYQIRQDGYNTYSDAFAVPSSGGLNFARGPKHESNLLGYFRHVYYYGKMSVSRDAIIPMTVSGRYSLGLAKYDTKSLPFANYSFGWQVYLQSRYYVELAYGLTVGQTFDLASKNVRETGPNPAPLPAQKGDFTEKIQISQNLDLSIGVLF